MFFLRISLPLSFAQTVPWFEKDLTCDTALRSVASQQQAAQEISPLPYYVGSSSNQSGYWVVYKAKPYFIAPPVNLRATTSFLPPPLRRKLIYQIMTPDGTFYFNPKEPIVASEDLSSRGDVTFKNISAKPIFDEDMQKALEADLQKRIQNIQQSYPVMTDPRSFLGELPGDRMAPFSKSNPEAHRTADMTGSPTPASTTEMTKINNGWIEALQQCASELRTLRSPNPELLDLIETKLSELRVPLPVSEPRPGVWTPQPTRRGT